MTEPPAFKIGDHVVLKQRGGANRRTYEIEDAEVQSDEWLYSLVSTGAGKPSDKRRTAFEHNLTRV